MNIGYLTKRCTRTPKAGSVKTNVRKTKWKTKVSR